MCPSCVLCGYMLRVLYVRAEMRRMDGKMCSVLSHSFKYKAQNGSLQVKYSVRLLLNSEAMRTESYLYQSASSRAFDLYYIFRKRRIYINTKDRTVAPEKRLCFFFGEQGAAAFYFIVDDNTVFLRQVISYRYRTPRKA